MAKRSHPLDLARASAFETIGKIADRAVALYATLDVRLDRQDVLLDITACHFGAQKLRLDELLAADDLNFIHDVSGINKHLDRELGGLAAGFSPRFSA